MAWVVAVHAVCSVFVWHKDYVNSILAESIQEQLVESGTEPQDEDENSDSEFDAPPEWKDCMRHHGFGAKQNDEVDDYEAVLDESKEVQVRSERQRFARQVRC